MFEEYLKRGANAVYVNPADYEKIKEELREEKSSLAMTSIPIKSCVWMPKEFFAFGVAGSFVMVGPFKEEEDDERD